MRNAKCKYCGAPSETGSGSFSSHKGEHFDLSCKACDEDLADFDQRPENAISKVPDYEALFRDEEFMRKRIQQHADRKQRQEEFMRRRVLERRSKGDA